MEMAPKEIIEFLQSTARSVGAEVASPWFYLQFGLILAAAGIAYAADAAIRARVDMASLAMRWPLPLRHFVRVLVASAVCEPADKASCCGPKREAAGSEPAGCGCQP